MLAPSMAKLGLALMVAVTGLVSIEPAGEAGAASTSALRAVTPCRLLDTRAPATPLPGPRSTTRVQVAGVCGVPAGAVAAALTVTAASARSEGIVTVYPDGRARPLASLLNYGAGETVSNGGLFELGAGGGIEVYTWAGTDLIVDVTAYFVAATESAEGRFVPISPRRVKDTRETGRPAPGSVVGVDPGVPADAVAVAVNLTTTASLGPGWFAAFPRGQPQPVASILNVDRAWQTRAASSNAPPASGTIELAARVCPARSTLRIEATGRGWPLGKAANHPGPSEAVVVRLTATATASAGTPGSTPTTEPGAGRPVSRVSFTRRGEIGTNRPSTDSGAPTKYAVTSTTRSVLAEV